MKPHRIAVMRDNDTRGTYVKREFESFGFTGITHVDVCDVYYLHGSLTRAQITKIAREVLCDNVVEKYDLGEPDGFEILYNPGVTDPKEASVKKAIQDIGLRIEAAQTGIQYIMCGDFNTDEMLKCASIFLYNPLVQHVRHADESMLKPKKRPPRTQIIDMNGDLMTISKAMGLSLSIQEMEEIRGYFARAHRMPSDVELETIAQTWSEHCRHKTFLGSILFDDEKIDNLLKSTIMKVTEEINHPMCLSVFHDNSGVIHFDEEYGICFKVETHNHPSALEPYGGAATGIGGVIRDILGTGLGAKPIMNTDVFCFGDPTCNSETLPEGILHPHTIIKGVIKGVRDYGNRMGIPTASGAIYFDREFLYNPLVFCGCVGLIKRDRITKSARFGDAIILVGGETGRDGIHGVTFASAELSEESEKSCVQIGNPIMEKRVLDCLMRVSDRGLLNAVTDCGGGGLSSAVGEMGKHTGVRVDLEKVPLKYEGLTPREIWISESQERMIMAVSPSCVDEVLHEFHQEGVPATVIGGFTDDHQLRLFFHDENVCTLDMKFLHDGLPMPLKRAQHKQPPEPVKHPPKPIEFNSLLLQIISTLNSCSREWVIREYDHEVQGGSVIKPLVGTGAFGPQDAVVFKPRLDKDKGIAVSCGINPSYGRLDAYNMALSVVDEALRNIVATGGDISKTALLDNFCFSSPEREEVLGDIVLSARGCYDAAKAFGTPFISGKDSLYNEWSDKNGKVHFIPPTLLISAISIINDVRTCITMDFKRPDSAVVLLGATREELGGSEYYRLIGIKGGAVPGVDLLRAPAIMRSLQGAIADGIVLSCHDISEGGLGLALAEMVMSSPYGVKIDLAEVIYEEKKRRNDHILFSETNTRFLLEISRDNIDKLGKYFNGFPMAIIGHTEDSGEVRVFNGSKQLISLPVSVLSTKWRRAVL